MADQNPRQPGSKDMASWKPGSESDQAKDIGGKGDFGVPAGSGPSRERRYVSDNTKVSDPGAAQPHSYESEEGTRTSGAGGNKGGSGSSSGGDIDTDIIGVGTGGSGVAQSGPGEPPGPDDSTGRSDEFASGPPAKGENEKDVGQIGGSKRVKGTTVSGDVDMQTGPPGEGADAATNPARDDDSFSGEVSSDEASGGEGG